MSNMSDEEKKAIEMLDKFITEHKLYNIKHIDGLEKNIEIVLKMTKDLLWKEEQQKELLKYKTDKIEKQFKVIDEMAKMINESYFCEENFYLWFEKNIIPNGTKCLGERVECIKQYFYRKVKQG